MKVHELRHGILQALPPAKPSYGGARRPRIAYTSRYIISYHIISYHILLTMAVAVVVRRCFLFYFCVFDTPSRIAPAVALIIALFAKNTTLTLDDLHTQPMMPPFLTLALEHPLTFFHIINEVRSHASNQRQPRQPFSPFSPFSKQLDPACKLEPPVRHNLRMNREDLL